MAKANPIIIRDFSRGRIAKSAVSEGLVPQNSVANSLNVNFDTTIGKAIVRGGTTKLTATVSANKTPLGLSEFVIGATNDLVAVFTGASTSTIYFYDTSWHASTVTNLSNTAKVRFAVLGGRIYETNGISAMTSSADGNTWATTNSIDTGGTIKPTLVFRSKARLLASGYATYPDRVYFSSVIDPSASPTLTWSTGVGGDWIDVNPDDNSNITGFAETSNMTLIFKGQGMYRLDVISKTVDTQNIFNIGAVSQEAIVNCCGVVYFFSGYDIRRTTGDLPEQISRLGVQDFIDAIPQVNWSSVCAGTDGLNVYFYIGTITLNANQDNSRTYSNVVLKFSTRDESWSVHSYADTYKCFCQFTSSANARKMMGASTAGNVDTFNSGITDNGTAIDYELETQEQEIGGREYLKKISDKIVIFMKNGIDTQFQAKEGDGDYKDVPIRLDKRVNIGENINLEDNYFSFKWFGQSSGTAPQIEGLKLDDIEVRGISRK